MFEPFLKLDISAEYQTVLTHSFRRPADHLTSIHPQHTIPYVLMARALGQTAGASNRGIHLRVLAGVGTDQIRIMTVDDEARRYSGRAVNLTIQAKLVNSSDSLNLVGGLAFDECEATTEVCAVNQVTNLLGSKDLTYAVVVTADGAAAAAASFGTIQREARRISLSCPAATSTTPRTVYLYGRRYQDAANVPLATFMAASGAGGGTYDLVDIQPGEFASLYYRIPSCATGDDLGKLYIWEELGTES